MRLWRRRDRFEGVLVPVPVAGAVRYTAVFTCGCVRQIDVWEAEMRRTKLLTYPLLSTCFMCHCQAEIRVVCKAPLRRC